MNSAEALAFIALAFVIVKIFGPMAVAIGHRIRGGTGGAPDHRLAVEVDELRTRLAEVEERLDFAERLLARGAQADQIPGGAQR
ncbi:MAG: hypothetical protein H0X69_09315 [Gemmatimonadales bacterium]|nr:hypothetical protein [Gemmatimonadales bacterium]